MDVSVKEEERDVSRSVPMSETSSNEQDRSQVILKAMFNGEKTYDNRTGEIQLSRRTTIETRTAGSPGHICYQDRDRRVSVTRAAVCMEEKGTGM